MQVITCGTLMLRVNPQLTWSRLAPFYSYVVCRQTYRVNIKSFPDYKYLLHDYVGTLRCTSVKRVSAVDNFPTRWCTSTLGFHMFVGF